MKKWLIPLTLSALVTSPVIWAQEEQSEAPDRVQITWKDPKSFTDVRPSNESRKRFREKTFELLEEHLEKLSSKLPEGQSLTMTVTDLDLAGRVWPGTFIGMDSAGDVRLIKRVDIPRMSFSYKLLDANGDVVKEGEESIKDMGFQERIHRYFKSDRLRYEKTMIADWFNDTFPELIAANR